MLPLDTVAAIVDVLTFGAQKYEPENWKHVDNAKDRYFSALFRHLAAWQGGEKLDADSGLSTLAHAGCCLLFLMWHDERDQ